MSRTRSLKVYIHNQLSKFVLAFSNWANIDLRSLSYEQLGILKCDSLERSGERFFLENKLVSILGHEPRTMFDVGANTGEYSKLAAALHPNATIYALEPNPNTFRVLSSKEFPTNVVRECLGLSDSAGNRNLFTYSHETASSHASCFREVFSSLYQQRAPKAFEASFVTLDDFCSRRGIESIDFLKLDTEGSELAALRGATRLLSEQRIQLIQFEFNEMNVVARVFLRDFFQLLVGYQLYRLDSSRLIPLGDYDARNEIFKFQNIIAISQVLNRAGTQ